MMNVEQWFLDLIIQMQASLQMINDIKGSGVGDACALSVAATNLETAMLWVANARPDAI